MITEKNVKDLMQGAKNVSEVAVGVADKLTAEAINLFVVTSLLSILKFSAVFIVFFIVKKYLDSMMSVIEDGAKGKIILKSLKVTSLILSIVFFTSHSFPHIVDITKALVAPNIFLLEKGKDFYKEIK